MIYYCTHFRHSTYSYSWSHMCFFAPTALSANTSIPSISSQHPVLLSVPPPILLVLSRLLCSRNTQTIVTFNFLNLLSTRVSLSRSSATSPSPISFRSDVPSLLILSSLAIFPFSSCRRQTGTCAFHKPNHRFPIATKSGGETKK